MYYGTKRNNIKLQVTDGQVNKSKNKIGKLTKKKKKNYLMR